MSPWRVLLAAGGWSLLAWAPARADDRRAGDALRARIEAAAPGAVIEIAAGTYEGPFEIVRPLHLRGSPGSELVGNGEGHVVDIAAPDVEVAGLLVRRSGANLSTDDAGIHVRGARAWIHDNTILDTLHGIYLYKAPGCRVIDNVIRGRAGAETIADPLTQGLLLSGAEMCSVTLPQDQRGNGVHVWNCSGHVIAGNDIRGTRDGIYFQFCNDTRVTGNVIADVRYGLHYMYSDRNVFEGNLFTRNAAGAAIMYSNDITLRRNRFVANRSHRAYGILLHTVERTHVEYNIIEGNTVGVFAEGSSHNTFSRNTIAANYIGLRLSDSSSENEFSGNVFHSNLHAVETAGLDRTNRFTTGRLGNYWDDAWKIDLDRDDVADIPHDETDLFGRWRRRFPEIGLLSGSPGERALRFLHARLHLPGLPGVRDEHPLVRAAAP